MQELFDQNIALVTGGYIYHDNVSAIVKKNIKVLIADFEKGNSVDKHFKGIAKLLTGSKFIHHDNVSDLVNLLNLFIISTN